MKTLRVTLADIEGAAHASTAAATSVTVSVAYSGQVVLTSGTVIPAAVKSRTLGSSGVVDFSVYASDDPVVRSEYRGFAVVVTATVRGPVGSPTTKLVRSVKPLESMGSTIQLGSLPPAEGLPSQWATVDEVIGDFDARLDSLEDHPVDHAARHATGGPDPITPASIGAVPADDPRLLDTGWQDVDWLPPADAYVYSGITYQRARRIGNRVHFAFRFTLVDAGGAIQRNVVVPAGWRPSATWRLGQGVFPNGATPNAYTVLVNSSGTVSVRRASTTGDVAGVIEWLVD